MRNRFFALVLGLALVATMLVAPASAQAGNVHTTVTTEACPCGCGKNLDSVTWKVWNSNEAPPTSGHYYLDDNYVQDGQKEIMAGDRVVLDLRGNTITSKTYGRLLLVYGRMHVLDTVGGGRFMSKTSGGAYGGVVMVSTNEVNDSMFELCSGTITKDNDNKGSRRGGLVHVSATATFRMTGGMLLNGTTVIPAGTYVEDGGCVAGINAGCTIEILGGKIIGGESANHGGNIYNVGTTILKNCEIIGGVAAKSGGNICQNGGSLTIENAIIRDGVANEATGNGGGNICAMSGTAMSVSDSTIRNGWAAWHGGNINLGTCNAVIENTVVEAGVAKNRGNNIYGTAAAASLTVRDCEFPGDITYIGKNLKLEGKVKIGLLNNGLRLWYNGYTPVVDAADLTEGSEIYVDANHTFTTPGAKLSYFKGAMRTVLSEGDEGLVGTYAQSGELGGYCPHCNERVVWNAFSTTASKIQNCLYDKTGDADPTCTGNHLENGHYYLTASQKSSPQLYVGLYQGGAVEAKDVVFDLAGYAINGTSARAFYIRPGSDTVPQSHLTLLDSYGGGTATGRGANNQGGGVIYNEGSKLTVYGGTYTYTPTSPARNVTTGGVVINGGIFYMYGGTLDGSAYDYVVTPYQNNSGTTVTPTITAAHFLPATALPVRSL